MIAILAAVSTCMIGPGQLGLGAAAIITQKECLAGRFLRRAARVTGSNARAGV